MKTGTVFRMLWNAKNGLAAFADAEMRFVSFGRGRDALVILPGLSDGLATVRGKALLLAGPYRCFLERYTVYIFSRRSELPEGHSIRAMADDQARAMKALSLTRASVMGVSQGGMIAQHLAADHPELVEKLVLAVTAPCVDATIAANVEKWIRLAEQGEHRALMIDTAEKSYSPEYLKKYRKLYPFLGMIGKPRSYGRFLVNARAILGFDASADLQRIQCPTLIIGGGQDRIVGAQAPCALRERIAGSLMHVYADLGHAAYEEAPDFNDRVFAFLEAR